jgi:hypothetical protein
MMMRWRPSVRCSVDIVAGYRSHWAGVRGKFPMRYTGGLLAQLADRFDQ